MKLSKKLLKEIYNSVDENLKAKIENEVPEINPKLEVGKWYKSTDGMLFNFQGKYSRFYDSGAYGFTVSKNWYENLGIGIEEILEYELAKPEEVKTALIAEAKRRGFTFGKYFKELQDEENGGLIERSGKCGKWVEFKDNKLFVIGYGRWKIFDNGTWATIINEPTQKELLQKQVDELKRQIDLL